MTEEISKNLDRLFDSLGISDGRTLEQLRRMATVAGFERGEKLPLRFKGEALLFILLKGCVCRELDTPDGRAVLDSICYRFGSVANPVGMITGETENGRCICLTDSEFAVFPMESLITLMNSSMELMRLYSERLTRDFSEQTRHRYMLSLRSEEKYAWFQNNYNDISEQIPMKVIAQFLNIDPATLSRLRKKMKEKSLKIEEKHGE